MGAIDNWETLDPGGLHWEREDVHWPGRLSRWCSRIMVRDYARGIEELARDRGWLIQGVGIREVDGCVYFGVIPIGGRNLPQPPRWLARIVMPLALKAIPEFRRRVKALDRDYDTNYWAGVIDDWTTERESALLAEADRLLSADLPGLSDADLAILAVEAMDHAGACMKEHFHLHGAGIHAISILGRELTADHGFSTAEFAGLFVGLSDATTGPAAAQQNIVDHVRAAAAEDLLRHATTLDDVRNIDPAVGDALEEYLSFWGRRAIRYQVAFPTVGERPDWILSALQTQLDSPSGTPDHRERQTRQREAAETRVLEALGDTASTRARIALAQKAAPIREGNETATVALPAAAARFIGLELGSRLVARGHLDAAEHAFDLEVEEVAALLTSGPESPAVPDNARELAATRYEHRTSDAPEPPREFGKPAEPPDVALFPPRVAETMGALLWLVEKGGAGADASDDGDAAAAAATAAVETDPGALRFDGVAASTGVYEGPARIIGGEHDFNKLEDGDVMVCPITSPIWSMLFPKIGALVCDAGGPMSHPAIISREFGIPAVLNVQTATETIKDGQVLRVDGDRGIVLAVD